MTSTTRQTRTSLVLASCVALLLAGSTQSLLAEDVTFQFRTTIDASSVHGPHSAPLVVTYTFDSNLENGDISSGWGWYVPIHMTLQVGKECVTATGAISIGNNAGGMQDEYNVAFDEFTFFGQLFGCDVRAFRFLLVDSDATMFDDISLPLSPAFAAGTDFIQVNLDLWDPTRYQQVGLGFSEQPGTPPEDKTPFSLISVHLGDPVTLIGDLGADVVSLGLFQGLENGLLAKLDGAVKALTDGNENNDHVAANKLEEFINQVAAQQGKELSEAEAQALIDEAENVIIVLALHDC